MADARASRGPGVMLVPGWDRHPGLLAVTTTRVGGVSTGPFASLNLALHVGDVPARVLANRARVSSALGIDPASWTLGRQVHGNAVAVVSAADRGRGALEADTAIDSVDGLVTDVADVTLCVLVADCVPVMLFDPRCRAIGIAHAGWRGTIGHVAAATVEAMRTTFASRPEDIYAFLGPSIGPEDYQVGDDVARSLAAAYPDGPPRVALEAADGRRHVDLRAANAHDLESAGLLPHHVGASVASTARRTDTLYSHRALGATGRFAALVRLDAP